MNYVLICEKKNAARYSEVIRENATLLGCETAIRNNTVSKIIDVYNPHAVVITRNVPAKGELSAIDAISLLRLRKNSIRIIYAYGDISDKAHFENLSDYLVKIGIFDIIASKPFEEIFPALANNPWDEAIFRDMLKEQDDTPKVREPEASVSVAAPITLNDTVKADAEALRLNDFDVNSIKIITEPPTAPNSGQPVLIGIAELVPNAGSTQAAFEIAELNRKKKKVCVVLENVETYNNLVKFHNLATATGISIHQLPVFPITMLKEILPAYDLVICDFGTSLNSEFYGAAVKILLCSAAEWHLPEITYFVNSDAENENRAEINYCFPATICRRYLRLSKQLMKAGCKVYRLEMLTNSISAVNKDAYTEIIEKLEMK